GWDLSDLQVSAYGQVNDCRGDAAAGGYRAQQQAGLAGPQVRGGRGLDLRLTGAKRGHRLSGLPRPAARSPGSRPGALTRAASARIMGTSHWVPTAFQDSLPPPGTAVRLPRIR